MSPAAEVRAPNGGKSRAALPLGMRPSSGQASRWLGCRPRSGFRGGLTLVALAVLALALAPDAHAEQAFVRTRALFAHRMDVGDNHSCAIAVDCPRFRRHLDLPPI